MIVRVAECVAIAVLTLPRLSICVVSLCSGIMGPREVQHTHNNAPAAAGDAASSSSSRTPCEQQNKLFMSCMKDNSGSIASCQSYFDSLSSCQREQPQMN